MPAVGKKTFASSTFRAKTFASGNWNGVFLVPGTRGCVHTTRLQLSLAAALGAIVTRVAGSGLQLTAAAGSGGVLNSVAGSRRLLSSVVTTSAGC